MERKIELEKFIKFHQDDKKFAENEIARFTT